MSESVRISEELRAFLEPRQRDDETMEETLRRLTRGPHPNEVAGLLSPEEAAELKESVKGIRRSDHDRKDRARSAFSDE